MRIAYLADNSYSANSFYRGLGPMAALASRGHSTCNLSLLKPEARFPAVRDVDVLHIHRYCDRVHTIPLAREAKAHGVTVVWDEDDDMGGIPKGHTAVRRRGAAFWPRRLQDMKTLFRLVDVVITPSPTLAQSMVEYGARRTTVIENYVPALFMGHETVPLSGRTTIGWLAGKEHALDVEQLPIREVLQRPLDERPDVHVTSLGLSLGLQGERFIHLERVDLLGLDKGIPDGRGGEKMHARGTHCLTSHTAKFDIAIAPLADIRFSRARSNVKLKEYAAGGSPWLASPVGPYLGMGEKQGGRLVPDDGWYEELSRLIDRGRERRKLAKQGSKWVKGETIEANAHLWEQALTEAIAHAADDARAPVAS